MKKWVFLFFLIICSRIIYADINFSVEIRNVTINGGIIILGIYFNEQSFRNQSPDITLNIIPNNNVIIQEIILSTGFYVIGVHQDTNGNGIMDYGLFGIPREPYGFSNMRGRIPGNFNDLKFEIKEGNNSIIIPLVRF